MTPLGKLVVGTDFRVARAESATRRPWLATALRRNDSRQFAGDETVTREEASTHMVLRKYKLGRRVLGPAVVGMILSLPAIWAWHRVDCGLLCHLRTALFADDAFYYYQVAWNILNGNGLTFDGYNTTNGFQPLWLILLLPVLALFDKISALQVIIALQLVLMTAAMACLVAMFRRCLFGAIAAVSCCFALACHPVFVNTNLHGLETSLYLLCFASTLFYLNSCEQAQFSGPRRAVTGGIMLALLCLSRTDGLIFAALVVGWFLVTKKWRRALLLAAPVGIVFVPYLMWNYLTFGALMPVSGAVKRCYSSFVLQAAMTGGDSWWRLVGENLLWPTTHSDFTIFGVATILNTAILTYYVATRRRILSLFHAFLILKYLAYGIVFFHHAQYKWYWTIDFLGPTLFLIVLTQDAVTRLRSIRHPAWLALVIIQVSVCAWFAYVWTTEETQRWRHFATRSGTDLAPANDLELIYWAALSANALDLPDDFRFGMNNSGVFGYFVNNPVTNFDGLINGRKRLRYIRKYGYNFAPYLDSEPDIDAYLDFIHKGATEAYDRIFLTRDFVYVDIARVLENLHGRSALADIGGLRLYVRQEHADLFREWSSAARVVVPSVPHGLSR